MWDSGRAGVVLTDCSDTDSCIDNVLSGVTLRRAVLLQLMLCHCVAGTWVGCKSYTSSCDQQAIWCKILAQSVLLHASCNHQRVLL